MFGDSLLHDLLSSASHAHGERSAARLNDGQSCRREVEELVYRIAVRRRNGQKGNEADVGRRRKTGHDGLGKAMANDRIF